VFFVAPLPRLPGITKGRRGRVRVCVCVCVSVLGIMVSRSMPLLTEGVVDAARDLRSPSCWGVLDMSLHRGAAGMGCS
jgi:hypothetical protein